MSDLKKIPVSSIRLNATVLRTVNKKDEKYSLLKDSIQKRGLLNPISVREIENPEDATIPLYSLIDGGNRLEATKDLGLEYIDASVTDIAAADALAAQIMANASRIETKPIEYTRAILELLKMDPTLTIEVLADRLNQSTAWINDRLGLLKLPEDVQKMVNAGALVLTNAIALSKLPDTMVKDFIDRAKTMTVGEFSAVVSKAKSDHSKAVREGKKPEDNVWTPTPHLRKPSELKEELKTPANVMALITAGNITSPLEAAKIALAWALNIDPVSAAQQKKEHESREAVAAAEKAKLKAEKAAKALEEANKVLTPTRG